MMETWESLFLEVAREQGHSEEYINHCLAYASKLHERNLPVIFDFNHLVGYVGWYLLILKESGKDISNCYDVYNIRKKSGGVRQLEAPNHRLKAVQKWVYLNILAKDQSLHECVHGFFPSFEGGNIRNIFTNALPHSNHKWVINIDLKNFFPNIKLDKIEAYFSSLGYVEEVAKILAWLCTYHSRLPQGAPTSPMLSNLIASQMDEELELFCTERSITYTRYADDLTFSGNEADSMPRLKELYAIIYRNGFFVNKKKTKIRKRGMKQTVTGLTVTDGVHVPKAYRKEVWRHLHFCLKFGPYEHYSRMGTDQGYYKSWLLGRIMFIRQIDPQCGNKMLESFNQVNWLI